MLTNIFNCPICYKPYDNSENLPKILVSCGHTFCLSCINQNLLRDAAFVCSFCPHSFISTVPELNDLPLNLFVIDQLTNVNPSSSPSIKILSSSPEAAQKDYPLCPLHNHKLKFVCLTDELLICKYCIRFGAHKGHNALHVQDVKSEAFKKIKQLTALAQDLEDRQRQSSCETEVEDLKKIIQINFDSLHLKTMLRTKEEEFLKIADRFFDFGLEKLLQQKSKDENILQQIGQQVHTLNLDLVNENYFTALNLDLTSNIQVSRIPQYLACLAKTAMVHFKSFSSNLSNKIMQFGSHLNPLSSQKSILSKNFQLFPRFLQTLFIIQEDTLVLDFYASLFEQELIKSLGHLWNKANDIFHLVLRFNSTDLLNISALGELCELDFWNQSQLKTLKIQVQGYEKCNLGLEKLLITTSGLKNLGSFSLIVPDTEINNSVLKTVSEFPLKKIKSLQELELNFAKTQITSEGFCELIHALSPITSKLKRFSLNLNGTQVENSNIGDFIKFNLSKARHLQSFSLFLESIPITKNFFRGMISLPRNFSTSLQNLVLDFRSTRLDDNDFKILHSTFIENAVQLQTLELYFSFTSLTQESLQLICQTLSKIAQNLQKIVLDFSYTKIKDIGVLDEIIPRFAVLETFELNLKKISLNKKAVQKIYADFLENKVVMGHLKHFKIKMSKSLKRSVKLSTNSINDKLNKIYISS